MTYGAVAYGSGPYAGPVGAAPAWSKLPTHALLVEFTAGTWTNVAADVVALSTRRGRNKESGAFETGQLIFTVRNDSRTYDPDHVSGPYYGKLRPNRRVRYEVTVGGATFPVFAGYVDRITQESGGPNDATATFQVSDAFKILNRVELPGSAYAAEVRSDLPSNWWRLGDNAGSTTAAPSAGAYSLTKVGSPSFGQPSLSVRDDDSAVKMNAAGDGLQGIFPEGTFPFTTAGTIEFLYRKDVLDSQSPVVGLYSLGATGATSWGVDPIPSSAPNVRWTLINNAGGTFDALSTGVNINDLATHHIAITWSAGSPIKIYVDGVDRTSGSVIFTGSMASSNKWAVAMNAIDYPPFIATTVGSVCTYDELALYTTALSAADIAAHNQAARTPWNGDLPGARLARILDLAAVPAADRNLAAGVTTLQATNLSGSTLAYAQKVEETTLGSFFVARDGDVTYIDRRDLQVGPYLTAKFALVDDDSGAGVPYMTAEAEVDEAFIVTRSTASREGSYAVTVGDAAAQTEFGLIDEVHDGLLHDSDAYSKDYAEWVLNTSKQPRSRIGTIALELTKDPAGMYPTILGLELGDRVTYKRKPQNVGAVTSLDMRVEAIRHTVERQTWKTELQLSPFNLAPTGLPVFVWGVTRWGQHVWGI